MVEEGKTKNGKYLYWVPIASEEHYLFPIEIAVQLGLYYEKSGKPAVKFVGKWCSAYERQIKVRPTYFLTQSGMRRCYSAKVYGKLLETCSHEGDVYSLDIDGHHTAIRKSEVNV